MRAVCATGRGSVRLRWQWRSLRTASAILARMILSNVERPRQMSLGHSRVSFLVQFYPETRWWRIAAFRLAVLFGRLSRRRVPGYEEDQFAQGVYRLLEGEDLEEVFRECQVPPLEEGSGMQSSDGAGSAATDGPSPDGNQGEQSDPERPLVVDADVAVHS